MKKRWYLKRAIFFILIALAGLIWLKVAEGADPRLSIINTEEWMQAGRKARIAIFEISQSVDHAQAMGSEEVEIAPYYMCDKCSEIFLNLEALKYCLDITWNMSDALKDYWELTGFEPPKN